MNPPSEPPAVRQGPSWLIIVAFAILYTAWGTTYLAIKIGVEELPPALFGGVRVALAGLLLLAFLAARGQNFQLTRRELIATGLTGICFFVGGNGLITVGEMTVASGAASVLVATTPLWLALMETASPWGERLRPVGWLGLFLGLTGVLVLLGSKLTDPSAFLQDYGPLLVIGSSFCWALGSFAMRYQRRQASSLVTAAYQMVIGGGCLALLGITLGEVGRLRPDMLWGRGMAAFVYLLVIGSLLGFVAFTWLLGRVSAVLVGTYAYVNPAVAILVGSLLGGETITAGVIGGMVIILAGVALVRAAGSRRQIVQPAEPPKEPTAIRARADAPFQVGGACAKG